MRNVHAALPRRAWEAVIAAATAEGEGAFAGRIQAALDESTMVEGYTALWLTEADDQGVANYLAVLPATASA